MTLSRSRIALVALAFVLGACSGGTATTGATGTPVSGGGASASAPAPTPTATATSTPTAVPSPSGSTALASLPPGFNACTLLTRDQVSAINGSTYPAGVNHVLNGGFIECVWQTPTPPSSITLQVLASSGDTSAQEAYANAEAEVHGFSVVTVPGCGAPTGTASATPCVGDEAEIARAPGVNTGGIYVRRGNIFYDVVYLNGTGATNAALVLAATQVLGNLP